MGRLCSSAPFRIRLRYRCEGCIGRPGLALFPGGAINVCAVNFCAEMTISSFSPSLLPSSIGCAVTWRLYSTILRPQLL
jgi:hypothetical protein